MKNWQKLLIAVGSPFVVSGLSSAFSANAIDTWYSTLNKPTLNPPNLVFGPVWALLYLLMGIAFYLIWKDSKHVETIAMLYFIHLMVNGAWSILFFTLQSPRLALIDIVVLLSLILVLTVMYFKQKTISGILMLPYITWVGFATYLNLSILLLN